MNKSNLLIKLHDMRLIQNSIVFLFVLLFSGASFAQTMIKQADKQYELHAFNLAIKSYMKVLEKQPDNAEALSKIGDCYWHLNRMDDARTYFERAITTGQADAQTYLQYGHTLKAVGQYESAKLQFLEYARNYPIEGRHFAESCDFALSRQNEASDFGLKNEYLNSPAADFGPALLGQRVVYSSARIDMRRAKDPLQDNMLGFSSNQLFASSRDANDFLKSPEFLRSELRNSYNEGPIAYSPDGRWVAITKNNFVDGTRQIPSSGIELSLHIAEADANGDWSNPIPFPYNGTGFSNGFACFSQDGQALFFASDRPDGFGGYDIYVSYRVGGSWSTPENLGAVVNSVGNEITPFYDGSSLYFASDWHHGFGGYDLFKADRSGNSWSVVFNMGTAINSPRDDYGFVFDPVNNLGYLTSNRVGGKGLEDIYRVQKNADNLTIQVVNAADQSPLEGVTLDFSNCGQGRFTTDINGLYAFKALQGLNCTVQVYKEGYINNSFAISTIGTSYSRNFQVLLRKMGEEYNGSVVNVQSGQPVDGVLIRAVNQSNGMTMEATSDVRGYYSLAFAPNSSYIIRYSRAGYVDVSRTLRTGSGDDKSILGNIALTPSSALIAGGSPLPKTVDKPAEYAFTETAIKSVEGYAVQIAAIAVGREFDIESYQVKMKDAGPVYVFTEANNQKVRIGPFATDAEARKALQVAKNKGYKTAFVVKQKAETPVNTSSKPSSSIKTPTDIPTSYSFTEEIPKTPAVSEPLYKVKLASYRDTRWFQEQKVADIGVVEKRKKDDFTIMLLGGYQSKQEAMGALEIAKKRGFTGAYLVTDAGGELKRVQ